MKNTAGDDNALLLRDVQIAEVGLENYIAAYDVGAEQHGLLVPQMKSKIQRGAASLGRIGLVRPGPIVECRPSGQTLRTFFRTLRRVFGRLGKLWLQCSGSTVMTPSLTEVVSMVSALKRHIPALENSL